MYKDSVETIKIEDTDKIDGLIVVKQAYKNCQNNTIIHFFTMQGLGNTWPESKPTLFATKIYKIHMLRFPCININMGLFKS